MPSAREPLYRHHRFPPEVISYAVWLYFRFPLSLRMVEEILAARGISVTHETIRQWGLQFGREFVNRVRRSPPRRRAVGSGAPPTRTGSFSLFWSRAGVIRARPRPCSASSSRSRVEPL